MKAEEVIYQLNEDPSLIGLNAKYSAAKAKKPCSRFYSVIKAVFISAKQKTGGSKCWPSAPKTPRPESSNFSPGFNSICKMKGRKILGFH
jgi:hypothetical protein